MKVRTILFYIYFMTISALLAIIALFTLPFPYRFMGNIVKRWGDFTRFGLRVICNLNFEVRGIEHLPKDKPVIIACKHQSAFETIGLFYSFLPYPVYVLKADLDKIPLWRILSQKAGALSVQRSQGGAALRLMLDEAKKFITQGRSLIIFPEGTRTESGKEGQYHSGVYALTKISESHITVVPAAINSGMFWAKGKIISSGTIMLEFMPSLEKNLSKKEFMEKLKETIEQATRHLEKLSDTT